MLLANMPLHVFTFYSSSHLACKATAVQLLITSCLAASTLENDGDGLVDIHVWPHTSRKRWVMYEVYIGRNTLSCNTKHIGIARVDTRVGKYMHTCLTLVCWRAGENFLRMLPPPQSLWLLLNGQKTTGAMGMIRVCALHIRNEFFYILKA
jgi:hypothetical protein